MPVRQKLSLRQTAFACLLLLPGCLSSENSSLPGEISGPGGGGGGPTPLYNCTGSSEFDFSASIGGTVYCSYGLGTIKADAVYAQGATGAGVTVAVIDTGIDATHVDLDANISPNSIDIVRGDPITDVDGHGTHVAGIIAAEKNNLGMHGVAYDATILAIRADTQITDINICGDTNPCTTFNLSDIVASLDYAAGQSADVINMSLGLPGTDGTVSLGTNFETALVNAMTAGAIVVVAAGNDSALEPSQPAAYAGDATVNASGQMIAVGAVDKYGDQATFSNDCGSAMDYCLVAPGVDIISDYPGDKIAVMSGTSQAAPFVSGAAALLTQLWPTLTAGEVVNILLTTATDLGAAGVDSIYGHGLLNLQAALTPLGTLEIVLTDLASGETVMLDGTGLSLGSAFGDALTQSDLLSRSFALDDYDRNFGVDLNDMIVHPARGFGFQALLGGDSVDTVGAELPNGIQVAMGISREDETTDPDEWTGMAADPAEQQMLQGFTLSYESSPGTEIRFGYGITPEQQMTGLAASEPLGLFWMAGDKISPQQALAGTGTGLSISRQIDDSSLVSLSWIDQKDDPDVLRRDASIGEFTMAHRFGNGVTGYASVSLVDEEGGFLGSDAAGGLAVGGADTRFYSLGGRYPLGAGVELIGTYTMGSASMREDGSSLLSDWSGIRADAFGAGLVKTGVLGSRDRIGFLAGQPLRVSSGSVTVTAPVEYLADKTVIQDSERVSMAPSGQEIDLQLAYDAPLGEVASLSTWLMMQMEPGHVDGADTAYGVGFRFGAEF